MGGFGGSLGGGGFGVAPPQLTAVVGQQLHQLEMGGSAPPPAVLLQGFGHHCGGLLLAGDLGGGEGGGRQPQSEWRGIGGGGESQNGEELGGGVPK